MGVTLVESGAALQSMRSSDFDTYSAYGEVVDNSLQAKATKIRIKFEYQSSTPTQRREPIKYVAFGDNGIGMDADTLHRCLQLGYSSRYNDRGGIGRFGVGATLAAINQCQKIEVYSKQSGGGWLYTFIDLSMITSAPPQMTEIPVPVAKLPPKDLNKLFSDDSGTLVIWSKYDRQPTDASEIIREFHIWAGRTYRQFIWENVEIFINGTEVKAIDPLYVKIEKTKFPDDEPAHLYEPMEFNWPVPPDDRIQGGPETSKIIVKMSLLPEFLRPSQGSGNATTARDRHIDLNEGISIVRNGREVFYGRIPYWPGKPFEEIDRWWGCEISFDAVLDKEFTVKNIKRGALPVKDLKEALAIMIEPTRRTALETVREVWTKARTKDKVTAPEHTVTTGHDEAERTAKGTATPNNIIDKQKNSSEEIKKYTDEWIKHADDQQRAAWRAKFEGQPFTILDAEWKGPEFFETAHLGGHSILRYNMRHGFFSHIEAIRLKLEEDDADNPSAQNLNALIDLLLIAYAKGEAMFDQDLVMSAERFIEQLRMNWGNYLAIYLETFNKEYGQPIVKDDKENAD